MKVVKFILQVFGFYHMIKPPWKIFSIIWNLYWHLSLLSGAEFVKNGKWQQMAADNGSCTDSVYNCAGLLQSLEAVVTDHGRSYSDRVATLLSAWEKLAAMTARAGRDALLSLAQHIYRSVTLNGQFHPKTQLAMNEPVWKRCSWKCSSVRHGLTNSRPRSARDHVLQAQPRPGPVKSIINWPRPSPLINWFKRKTTLFLKLKQRTVLSSCYV